MRITRRVVWCLAGVAALPLYLAANNRELIKAPAFENSVLELFATDARTKIGSGSLPGEKKAAPPGTPNSAPGESPAAAPQMGDFAWSKLISSDSLESEIKSLGTVAADAVKTPNNFKSKGREVAQGAFTELAMLFGVISQFDGDVKWKKDALGLEKAYAQAGNNCKTSSDAAYKEAKKRTEDLGELFKGGSIELPKADGPGTWHELLNRPVLMKRLEEARQGGRVAKYTGSKAEFKKGKDKLMQEAQVLAVISEVIKDQGFESANDESYQKFAQAFQGHCLALVEAVKSDDADKAQAAFAQVSKACDTCHGDFR